MTTLQADEAACLGGQPLELNFDFAVLWLARAPARFDIPARAARQQQAAERRVLALVGACPPYDDLVLGPGEGNVEVAQVFATALLVGQLEVGSSVPIFGSPYVELALLATRVVEDHRLVPVVRAPGVPQIRAVDNWELQALGPVDRQHLDRGRIGVEAAAPLLGFSSLALVHPANKPIEQGREAQLGLGGLGVEQFGHVGEVSELALPVHVAEQPPWESLSSRDVPEERRHTGAPSQVGPLVKACVELLPAAFLRNGEGGG